MSPAPEDAVIAAIQGIIAKLPSGISPDMVKFALVGTKLSEPDVEQAIKQGLKNGSLAFGPREMLVMGNANGD